MYIMLNIITPRLTGAVISYQAWITHPGAFDALNWRTRAGHFQFSKPLTAQIHRWLDLHL